MKLMSILDWIVENKEWLFSGSGLIVFSMLGFFYKEMKNKKNDRIRVAFNHESDLSKEQHANMKVAVGIVQKGSEVLLVKRKVAEGNLKWTFPTGVVKPAANPTEVVEREIFKETNIVADVKAKIGERIHPDNGMICLYFHCEYKSGNKQIKDKDELESVVWVNSSEINRFITSDLYHKVIELIESFEGVQ